MIQSITFTLIGILLWFIAGLLARRQLETQRLLRKKTAQDTTPLETRFHASQCRRRLQCSVLLAALAVGMILESWITSPVFQVSIGAMMLVIIGWLILLAALDIFATTSHYRRLSDRYQCEQIKLEAKIKKILNDDEGEAENGN